MKTIKKICSGLLYIGLGLIEITMIFVGVFIISTPVLWIFEKINNLIHANSNITQKISIVIFFIILIALLCVMIYNLYMIGKLTYKSIKEKIEGRKIKKNV